MKKSVSPGHLSYNPQTSYLLFTHFTIFFHFSFSRHFTSSPCYPSFIFHFGEEDEEEKGEEEKDTAKVEVL